MSGDHNMHQKPKSYLDSSGIMDKLKEDDARTWASIAIVIERRKVAQWMMDRGYATGHGDTIDDLLRELDWQITEGLSKAKARGAEGERKFIVDSLQKQADLAANETDRRWTMEMIAAVTRRNT